MNAANPMALYDALHCAMTAVDEAGSERPALARLAWAEAETAASRAFPPGAPCAVALEVILDATRPERCNHRAALYRTLEAASLAVLLADAGDLDAAAPLLLDASGAASSLPSLDRAAVARILDAITGLAVPASGAVA